MALIVLIAICFLPCSFYLYVLSNWARDTHRRKTFSGSKRQAVITGTNRLVAKPFGLAPKGERGIHGSGIGWSALEKNVYGVIATSLLDNHVQPKTRLETTGVATAPRLVAVEQRDRRTA
jgi:hypothetical protein